VDFGPRRSSSGQTNAATGGEAQEIVMKNATTEQPHVRAVSSIQPTSRPLEANHRIGVLASPDEVYRSLTDRETLARWWTSDTRGDGTKIGGTLEFWFGKFCQKFRVEALEPAKLVRWKATEEGMTEWVGTEVSFTLSVDRGQTLVRFRHTGWREETEFFAHCSMKWATFLMSLKDLLEKGEGRPAPHDVAIEHN
jgi:uncharacterized protein YndB with AHSA1/START domain